MLDDVTQRRTFAPRRHKKHLLKIIFTLYPAHSTVGRGNLVLRYSVPHFPPSSGDIACWRNLTLRFALTPERRNENINENKYLISSSGDRPYNQTVLQSQFVPLRRDRPPTPAPIIK